MVICPDCSGRLPVNASDSLSAIICGGCDRAIALAVSNDLRGDEILDTCPICEGHDFYLRKDFDPKLGLAVVMTGALISAGFYWYGLDLIAYGVLGVAALVDLFVYGRLKDLSVCYRDHTEFRGGVQKNSPDF
ncbi:MAG TPA: hypothetical protein EYM79_12125 [Planctomycetes bacterium]|nr:hypothetical protein [Planctomycetota bacterium]